MRSNRLTSRPCERARSNRHFVPYDLRHTYGTRASEGGTDSLSLMRLMGHADLKTTLRYVHLSKRHLAEAQKRIEKYRAEREIAEAEARTKGIGGSAVKIPGTFPGNADVTQHYVELRS